MDRFNDASRRATETLGRLRAFDEAHGLPVELKAILNDYVDAVGDMLETSSELIAPALGLADSKQA